VLTSEDGSIVFKPALPLELEFYQTHVSNPVFEPLRPFLPTFLGTLKLQGKIDESDHENLAVKLLDEAQGTKESLVLENLSHSFSKPNILDIKLGTVLYDESASPEKRARMEKTALATTSGEAGIRITGFQVYDNSTSEPVITPKSYGKSIKVSDLPEAIARFFPIAPTAPSSSESTTPPAPSLGLPQPILLSILELLREDVADILEALKNIHLRIVGGSLLIVYEADRERAAEGVKAFELEAISDGSSDEQQVDEEGNEDEEEEEDGKKPLGPPYIVKLIDFAHTRFKPGEGADEGVLLGLSMVLTLLNGRIEQVRNAEV
jgi:1D-myo-inositol-tetrakisphosphate 5-kinase/inositol-polyphosphate multikinase